MRAKYVVCAAADAQCTVSGPDVELKTPDAGLEMSDAELKMPDAELEMPDADFPRPTRHRRCPMRIFQLECSPVGIRCRTSPPAAESTAADAENSVSSAPGMGRLRDFPGSSQA
jgi:hypothetical protein